MAMKRIAVHIVWLLHAADFLIIYLKQLRTYLVDIKQETRHDDISQLLAVAYVLHIKVSRSVIFRPDQMDWTGLEV